MITKQQQIDALLDSFDFERVHKAMEALDWEWSDSEGVPSIFDLRQTARQLLKDISETDKYFRTSTGGFTISKDKFGRLELAFEIDRQDAYDVFGEKAEFEK